MKRTLLVVGSSRGIGAAVARFFHDQGDTVLAVSRTPAAVGEWIEADLSSPVGIRQILKAVGDRPIDGLLFIAGVWEKNAFSPDFDFTQSPAEETQFIINVNLVAPIELTKSLVKNLSQAENPRAIYMGSISGTEQEVSAEVATAGSKFGLRGAVMALRHALKPQGIGFTVINPGWVATDEVVEDMASGQSPQQVPIPMDDVVSAVNWVLSLSPHTEVGEIDLLQNRPGPSA